METTRQTNPAERDERAEQRRDRCNELRALMDRHTLLAARLKALSDKFLALGDPDAGRAHEYWARMQTLLEEDARLLERVGTVGNDVCDLSPQS